MMQWVELHWAKWLDTAKQYPITIQNHPLYTSRVVALAPFSARQCLEASEKEGGRVLEYS